MIGISCSSGGQIYSHGGVEMNLMKREEDAKESGALQLIEGVS